MTAVVGTLQLIHGCKAKQLRVVTKFSFRVID